MTSLLFGIILAALLSGTSLIVILLRVSPLLTPLQALPAFFGSLFLTVSSICTLGFYLLWQKLHLITLDLGKLLSISLRQGIFLGLGTSVLLFFHLLDVLNLWVGILIYTVFVLIELALHEQEEEEEG